MNEMNFIERINEEFAMEKRIYTEEDYIELQRNLILYKQGNAEATTYIIKSFHQFITKYVRFIKQEVLPYNIYKGKNQRQYCRIDPSIAKFITLFIDKSIKKEDKSLTFFLTRNKIYKLFSRYEYEDIYNELVLALLNMANKYKITKEGDNYHKKNGTFHMYILKCFHWEAFRFLSKLIHDPVAHLEYTHLCDQFDDIEIYDCKEICVKNEHAEKELQDAFENANRTLEIRHSDTITLKEETPIDYHDLECLNFNWINGVTCSELFQNLTSYERQILVEFFINKKTDSEIASYFHCCRITIGTHRRRAIAKVKEKAITLGLMKEKGE